MFPVQRGVLIQQYDCAPQRVDISGASRDHSLST